MESNINYWYTIGFVIVVNMSFIKLGYWYSCFNMVTQILHRQYMLNDMFVIQDRDLFNSVISALIPFGATIGAPFGGLLISIGRRKALISVTVALFLGWLLTTVFNFIALFTGRLIVGICLGWYISIVPSTVAEFAPKQLSGPLGIVCQFMWVTGSLVAMSIGFAVPYAEEEEALTTEIWRLILGFPMILAFIQLVLFTFVFTLDTPKYYLLQGDHENYSKVMGKIYLQSEQAIPSKGLLDTSCSKVDEKSNEPTWSELFKSPNLKPLIVGLLIGVFHQTTGISSVTFFSNEIFSKGFTGTEAEFIARVGTFGSGIAAVLSVIFAMVFVKSFGRKTILIAGEIAMCILLALLSNWALNNNQTLTIIFTIVFVFVFNGTFGSILWVYVTEIVGARACSLVAFINLLSTGIFGCFANIMFSLLTSAGVYLILFFIQIVCIIFMYKCVIETKGLSKEECACLYAPNKKIFIETTIELQTV